MVFGVVLNTTHQHSNMHCDMYRQPASNMLYWLAYTQTPPQNTLHWYYMHVNNIKQTGTLVHWH